MSRPLPAGVTRLTERERGEAQDLRILLIDARQLLDGFGGPLVGERVSRAHLCQRLVGRTVVQVRTGGPEMRESPLTGVPGHRGDARERRAGLMVINDVYQGPYTVVEAVDSSFLARMYESD